MVRRGKGEGGQEGVRGIWVVQRVRYCECAKIKKGKKGKKKKRRWERKRRWWKRRGGGDEGGGEEGGGRKREGGGRRLWHLRGVGPQVNADDDRQGQAVTIAIAVVAGNIRVVVWVVVGDSGVFGRWSGEHIRCSELMGVARRHRHPLSFLLRLLISTTITTTTTTTTSTSTTTSAALSLSCPWPLSLCIRP